MVLTSLKRAIACLLATAAIAYAAVVTRTPVVELVKNADVVVAATVTNLVELGHGSIATPTMTVPGRKMSGELRVARVLKGPDTLQQVDVEFVVPDKFIGYLPLIEGDYRIYFLKRNDNSYALLNPYRPSVPALAGASLTNDDVMDNIRDANIAVVESSQMSPGAKREAISILQEVDGKGSKSLAALRIATGDVDDTVRLTAAAALLAAGDASVLPLAEDALSQRRDVSPIALLNLRVGLAEAVMQQEAIPALARIIQNGDIETRRAAYAALGHTRSQRAVPLLMSALDDSDSEIVFTAVSALSEIEGEKGPSPYAFHLRPRAYAEYWKDRLRGR